MTFSHSKEWYWYFKIIIYIWVVCIDKFVEIQIKVLEDCLLLCGVPSVLLYYLYCNKVSEIKLLFEIKINYLQNGNNL